MKKRNKEKEKERESAKITRYNDGGTVCPRGSDPFYIVSYYIKWATTSWTHSII